MQSGAVMFKNNTVIQKFYFSAILLATITLGVGVWHYWHNGSANIKNISKVFDASLKLQQIKKENTVPTIRVCPLYSTGETYISNGEEGLLLFDEESVLI